MIIMMLGLGLMFGWRAVGADTVPTLFNSFAGNINFIGTQKTLRTQDNNGDACAITTGTTTAALAGLPAGATIRAAYLYWAGSGTVPDYTVTFEGGTISSPAARSYTATYPALPLNYFSGAVDVTAIVAAKGNGTYSFTNLTVNNTSTPNNWCGSSAVLGGWAMLVIYAHPSEDFRVINVYEGFQHFQNSSFVLTPSNFQIPVSPINGKDAHLTWEGDPPITIPTNEQLTFNGNALSDATNPGDNQFNSVSNINSDTASYGVDFDTFSVDAYLAAGQTSATTVYGSGQDLVLLSAQIISTTNEPVADIEISMTRNGVLTPGQNASYTLNIINEGPLNEAGPVTVTDTLPAGLSYVSASGTGWSCGAAGQVVTCNYSGSLANAVSAPALTLTVAVAAGASGMITNTATVDGQAFDNISWNNTATDNFYVLPAPYAYYAMDEVSWGTVLDSSGNGRNATNLGAGTPTGYPPPSSPGSAIAGNPGTCGAGAIPATAGTQAVNTAIDVNSLGNVGTIAFWYNGNFAWNNGALRKLFDASADLGNESADKNFFLSQQANGSLRFSVEDTGDTASAAVTGALSYVADTWHHIAVVWNLPADRLFIYVDGVLSATSTTNVNGTLGNVNTLYVGDSRLTAGLNGPPTGWTVNSADGYLDEVRLYSSALSAADVAAVSNLTHSCGALLHHVQIEHGSGGGLTCNPSTLTVRACADVTCSSFYTGGATGSLTAAGSPTVNWAGGAGFTIASGASSVTKDVQVTTPGSVVFGTSGVSPVPSGTSPTCNFGAPSCTFTAADSGFVFDVPNHTADAVQNVVLSAVRNDDATQRCIPAFQSVAKTVNFWSSYLNPNSGTLAINVNGTNVSGAGPGVGISLNFDALGQVTVPVRYPDVGQMRLSASHSGSGDAAGLVMTGQDDFIAKPSRFALVIPGNPAAADASGGVFKRAGENFTITVEARNSNNAITPNYGRESTVETVLLTKALVAPAGGNNPALGGSFGVFGQDCSGNPGAAGTACGAFNWPEVGIITLTPSVGDGNYLGSGDASGTASGNVGRFTPDHFTVTSGALTNRVDAGCAPVATFTYMGEMLRLGFTLTAQSTSPTNATTQNYVGTFAKLAPTSIAALNIGAIDTAAPTPLTSRVATDTSSGSWSSGAANILARVALARAAAVDGPFQTLRVGVAPTDPDGVTLTSAGLDLDIDNNATNDRGLVATTSVRFGRLFLQNAFGSELLDLAMPLRAQYYADANTGFVTNNDDACTTTGLSFGGYQGNLAAGETCVQDTGSPGLSGQGCAAPGPVSEQFREPPLAGNFNLYLRAPGNGNDGAADITLTSPSWLDYDWDGNGTHDNDPAARATFGVYKGNPRNIYLRERY